MLGRLLDRIYVIPLPDAGKAGRAINFVGVGMLLCLSVLAFFPAGPGRATPCSTA